MMNFNRFSFSRFATCCACTAATAAGTIAAAPPASAQEAGDGAPHIAVAQEPTGEFELEFEVSAGFDDSVSPPVLTLDNSAYSTLYGGFRTFPVNDTPSPNDDLGFVSEVEGVEEEGVALSERIGLRRLRADDDFRLFDGVTPILTTDGSTFSLGNAFDFHPVWVLDSADPSFQGTSEGSFELFSEDSPEVLGAFDVRLNAVPEPTTAVLAGAMGLLLLRRRRA